MELRTGWLRVFILNSIAASLVMLCASVTCAQDSVPIEGKVPFTFGTSALQHLRDDDVEKTLEVLGEASDSSQASRFSPDPTMVAATGGLYRELMQLSEDEQFDLLYKWSMPTDSRKTVRVLTSLVPQIAPPKAFARVIGERPRDSSFPISSIGDVRGLFSTGWSLVQAADEIGRLRRLTSELQQLADDKVPNADVLLLLVHLADSNSDTSALKKLLELRVEVLRNSIPKPGQPPVAIDSSNVVLAAAALTHEELRPISEEMFNLLVELTFEGNEWRLRPFLRLAHATAVQLNLGESGAEVLRHNRLKYWVPASGTTSALQVQGAVDATWLVHEDHILHLAGSHNDVLFFRYPLTGEFEFRCEAQEGGHIRTEGGLVYGGLQFEALGTTSLLTVWDADIANSVQKACPFVRHENRPTFNRMSIRSTAVEAILTANLHPVWFDKSSEKINSPWLGLRSFQDRRPMFRNFAITGNPVIPREVRLSDGNSLRGWQSHFYGESQAAFVETSRVSPASATVDWTVESGVISAAKQDIEQKSNPQSLLHYQRPLLDGESISYEFHYEPGEFEVHPALGRLAFLIEPTGVRVHWMTDGDSEWTGLPTGNAVLEPLNRRGPRPSPLKENDWNVVTLAREDGKVTLSLNGDVIYQRAIDFGGDHTFGFYRDRTKSSVKIRNVVMTGDWPEALPEDFIASPAVVASVASDAEAQPSTPALSTLLGEQTLADNVIATRDRAAALSGVERFDYLSSWVLPSKLHSTIRMTGAFTQTEPAAMTSSQRLQGDMDGGELISPVFDFLDVAKELGRLDELRKRIIDIPSGGDEFQQRAKAALLVLVNLEIGDQTAASEATGELFHRVAKTTPTGLSEMWPETLVVYRGSLHHEANHDIAELLSSLFSNRATRSIPAGFAEWHALISTLMLRQQYTEDNRDTKLADSTAVMNDWVPVGRTLARTRGRGAPNAVWSWNGREVRHLSSHDNDFLFFRTPMRGNFEVEGDVVGYGKTQIQAGGLFFGPKSNIAQLETGTFRKGPSTQEIAPPFTRFNPWVHFRVVFRDGICTKYINGRLVLTEELPEHYDPWIGFRSWYKSYGGFRNVRITGNPEIPETVAMSASSEMIGWLSYFEEPIGYHTARWRYEEDSGNGGEIIGRQSRNSLSGTFLESLLRYHRPLVEDGSIEYDFYYEPEKTLTHPSLDRLAFMLDPAGVRIHSITDGRSDRTNVSPDNMFDESQNRRGPNPLPLKVDDWNHMELRITGSTLALVLNGQLIYEYELASTNRRTFGLFHYPGQTEIRVRNVFMRGDWSKTIPSALDQKLVDPLVVSLDAESSKLKAVFTHDFTKNGLPPEYFKTIDSDKQGVMKATSEGYAVFRPGRGAWTTADLLLPFNVFGDYDIEVAFDQLQVESNKDSCIMLITHTDDKDQTMCRNTRIHTAAQNDEIHPSFTILHADRTRSYGSGPPTTCEANAGRLRLARRGKTVYYLFAEHDSDAYQIVGREEVSDKPLLPDGIQLRALCFGDGETRVLWKNITLRAERLTYLPRNAPVEPKSLYTMNSDGTDLQIVTTVPDGYIQFGSPEWSADGKQITFDASNGGTPTSHVMVINADGTNLRDLGMGCMPSFSGDGKRMVFSQPGKGVVMMNSDGTQRETIDRRAWGIQWSPDGKHIAYGKSGNITILNLDTGDTRQLLVGDQATQYSYIYWNLGWSHDSRSVCTKARNRKTNAEEVIVADIDSPDGFKVLQSAVPGINVDFTWGPENKNILFAMHNPFHKGPQLYLTNRENPAAPMLLPGQPLDKKIYDCAWSPDGKKILFSGQLFPQEVEWPPSESKSSPPSLIKP